MSLLQGVLNSLRPAVVAMIASAGISILITAFWGSETAISLSGTDWIMVALFGLAVVLIQKVQMNPILVMTLMGVAKAVLYVVGI